MRKIVVAGVGALALALGTAAPALADGNNDSGYGKTQTTLTENDKCGTFTVTWINNTPDTFFGDYEMGQQDGKADAVTGTKISEGPLAGDPFGKRYHLTPIPAGETVSKKIELPPKYASKGEVTINAWIKRGPEQRSFSEATPITITTCEPETTEPTTPPADDGDDTGDDTPPTSGDDTTPPAEEPSDDTATDGDNTTTENGDNGGADEADEDGTAPTPEPQDAHIAVTG